MDGVVVFRIDGPVFFGIAGDLLDTLRRIGSPPEVVNATNAVPTALN